MNMSSLLLICYFNYKYANLYITYDKYLKETSTCTFMYILLYSNFGVRHMVQPLLSLSANSRNNNDMETLLYSKNPTPLLFRFIFTLHLSIHVYIMLTTKFPIYTPSLYKVCSPPIQ